MTTNRPASAISLPQGGESLLACQRKLMRWLKDCPHMVFGSAKDREWPKKLASHLMKSHIVTLLLDPILLLVTEPHLLHALPLKFP